MTVRTPPTFLQAGSHTAENTRLAHAGLFGSPTSSFAGGVQAFDPGHGVAKVDALQLAVQENGTPDMSVDVQAGSCFIRGTESASQGVYHFFNDATVNLSISAADPTNARWDLVVAQVRDAGYSGSDDDARLFVVEGTPAGSPADPTLPENCLVLARVVVGASVSSITSANITDLRTYARPWNTAWGEVARVTRTSDVSFSTTSFVDATGLSIANWVSIAGRRYKTTFYGQGAQSTNNGFIAELRLTDGSNNELQRCHTGIFDNNHEFPVTLTYVSSPGAATNTYKMRGRANIASCTWRLDLASGYPGTLVIEDVGPA